MQCLSQIKLEPGCDSDREFDAGDGGRNPQDSSTIFPKEVITGDLHHAFNSSCDSSSRCPDFDGNASQSFNVQSAVKEEYVPLQEIKSERPDPDEQMEVEKFSSVLKDRICQDGGIKLETAGHGFDWERRAEARSPTGFTVQNNKSSILVVKIETVQSEIRLKSETSQKEMNSFPRSPPNVFTCNSNKRNISSSRSCSAKETVAYFKKEPTTSKHEETEGSAVCDQESVDVSENNLQAAWKEQLDGNFSKYGYEKSMEIDFQVKAQCKAKRHKCSQCGKLFVNGVLLDNHFRTHTGEKPFQCEDCRRTYFSKPSLNAHIKTHLELKPYKCTVCSKEFTHYSSLTDHIKGQHTGEIPYSCDVCGKSFNNRSNLRRHRFKHAGVKPHVCDICGLSFVSRSSLVLHSRTHTGEKPYSCSQCPSKFSAQYSLLKHRRTVHEKDNLPYGCDVCSKRYSLKWKLKEHMRLHDGGDPRYTCEVCGKKHPNKRDLDVHVRKHTGVKPYKCSICHKDFRYLSSLATHMKRSHVAATSDD